MQINSFSLMFIILLSKLSLSESVVLKPRLALQSQTFDHNDKTFTEPTDYFDSHVTIASCKFLNCFSDEMMEGHTGGALYFIYCTAKISDSLFDNCAASQGGAIYSEITEITIKNTNFTSNQALELGGAVVLYQCDKFQISGGYSIYNDAMFHGCFDIHESNGTISSHNFLLNTAKYDCACISVYESQAVIEKCYFVKNEAETYPGAIQVEEGEGALVTSCIIKNCIFVSNKGGNEPIAIHLSGNITGAISNCQFDVNPKEAIIEYRSPNIDFKNVQFVSEIRIPFESLLKTKPLITEFQKVFDHSRSNYIAVFFIVVIPIYALIVVLILNKN